MALHLRAWGPERARPVVHPKRRPWGAMALGAGMISLVIGAAMLALTFAPMFFPAPSVTPLISHLAMAPILSGEAATVVAPQAVIPEAVTTHPAVATPVDGFSFEMRIPAIGYQGMVHQGVSLYVLAGGPGHYPGTPWPGQGGNVGVAGHNTFWLSFNRLKPGDRVEITTQQALYVYEITGSTVVDPNDRTVLAPTADSRLTLTTCYPLWAGALATKRLIFSARFVG
jgi:sortase A